MSAFPALEQTRAELKQIFNEAGPGIDFTAVTSVPDDCKGDHGKVAKHVRILNDRLEELKVVEATVGRTLGGNGGLERGDDSAGTLGKSFSPGYAPAPSLMPDAAQLGELHAAVVGRKSVRTEIKATVTSANTGADQLAVQMSAQGRMVRRIAEAARIPSEPVAGITSKEFPVFGAGDAGITAEGAAKTEYDAITPGSATPQMITIWTDTTRQNVLTMTGFEARLRTVHAAKVARREDLLLLSTVTGTVGIQTLVGALSADLVLEGAAKVAAGEVGVAPNLVAINPADAPTLLGTTVGAGGTASPPFREFLPSIHGLQVYPTDHVAEGEAVIGAWAAASRFIVGIPPTVLVDGLSGLKTNALTVLLEEAVALAVDEPTGFLHITAT